MMPRLSVWMIRASLVHLVVGWSLGTMLLSHKALPWATVPWRALAGHMDLLLFGFMAQLAFGTAFWILPRWGGGRSRGWEAPAWWSFGLVNAGPVLVGLAPVTAAAGPLTAAGRLTELAAAAAFAFHAWPRVKGFGR